jgi:hypothetical protein
VPCELLRNQGKDAPPAAAGAGDGCHSVTAVMGDARLLVSARDDGPAKSGPARGSGGAARRGRERAERNGEARRRRERRARSGW